MIYDLGNIGPAVKENKIVSRFYTTRLRRLQNPDGGFVDIIQYGEDGWEIQLFDHRYKKRRTVKIFFNEIEINPGRFNPPERLKLTSHDYPGHALDMDLIEAVPLEDNT